ncbi:MULTISPECIES: Na+/H+ antiporter NhaC family protein [Segatella]|jgi:Na+/H+ antiporter family protein|uniref:Na+/H+ antiporter NhaC family protein n=1 Tax=Segatella copri TaxID=165179 RepID=A0AAW9TC02_9BACT|nr:Na+/H+ antiporter NhaC family protein [Segatella copri]MQN27720.1 Na+/H+ antiporter NhaC family protein [Segatella copri]MQN31394.1 Na+/H+ antiporter NhaC family protein [Segatella copri]MQN37327.1 Na+/H+ antiporter NhaC family protein [Segatella copri]MQN74972.1 Na+/H+ antiporter NhaC family protein [Segatella copri]MQO27506.1 Na+/H+ antiporter NhaC family protein [Segatella copri]
MSNKKGLLALSPLFLLIVLIVAFTVYSVDSSHQDTSLSLTVAFMISSIYAVAISGGMPVRKRVDTYSKGAGANNLMLMLWIYVLAGSFAASAKAMGAVDATVNLALSILPASMILPGLFLAACFISVSIGTSVGTVVALVPIAAGLAHSMDANVGMMTAIIVGGAYFGDNLSFISDTTVVATQTQNCKMSDKFKVNSMIVVPAAVLVLIAYSVMGVGLQAPTHINEVEYMKVLPYLTVLVTAIAGMNVMAVLTLGALLCGAIGIGSHLLGASGSYDLFGWFSAMGNGIIGMGELIIIAMMAGGMLEIIRENGGIDFIINKITAHVNSKRGAELSIAALVSMVNICTANNTVAILTVGNISKKIGDRFGVDNRKAASILDTFSCMVQGLIPYGVQMLLAAGLANLSPMDILPYLYYPLAIGVAALLAILLRYPKRYS